LKFRRSRRGFVAPVRAEISTHTKIREIRTATKGCALFCGAVTRRKLLLSYLHVESRHNETHVVTVDAASGADLLSRTRFPGRRSKRRRKRSNGREREGRRTGEWAKKTALCEAAFGIGDTRPWRSNQDHDSLDDLRLSRSCRRNVKKSYLGAGIKIRARSRRSLITVL